MCMTSEQSRRTCRNLVLILPDRVRIIHHGLVSSLTVAQLKFILEQIGPQHSLQRELEALIFINISVRIVPIDKSNTNCIES